MDLQELLRDKRSELLQVADRYGARNLRIFGSVARGEASPESDIDMLVDFEPGRSLLDLSGLLLEFEAILGRRVDVVSESGLRDRMRRRILEEAVGL